VVFAAACTIADPELKSVAPADTKLEVLKSRMDWIKSAAEQFHYLMQTQPAYMEGQLQQIASWADLKDGTSGGKLIRKTLSAAEQEVKDSIDNAKRVLHRGVSAGTGELHEWLR
jgi:hypothetical protein